ncbi:MAG TPA: TlpA disulfide reductase family protein [Desulfurivibrionaceae bacterium]|nr:TlpA disulfide reductase family protein [Desulfurivibrionaceae bacterium]
MHQNTRRHSLLTFFLLTLSLLFLSTTALAATPMPRFVLPSVTDGKAIDSNTFKGKVLLVNFWATWCPPCRKEIPSLVELQEKYAAKGFSVIGISTDQGGSSLVAKFIQKMNVNYPVVLSDNDTPRNFGNILGIPTTFLVDKDGNVRKRYDGYVDHETLERDLLQFLK